MKFRHGFCASIFMMLIAATAYAQGPAQLIDAPPDVDSILFASDALYLNAQGIIPAGPSDPAPFPGTPIGTSVEIHFRMDRKTGQLTRIDTYPADVQGIPISTISLVNMNRGWSSAPVTYLGTSDGQFFVESDPTCGSIGNMGVLLTLTCKPVPSPVTAGEQTTSVESFGDYLLIGTLARAVPSNWDTASGRGILVTSSQNGTLVRTIGRADGLPGNRIKLIRRDPVTGNLWIETPRALTELSPKFEVLQVWYLHLGFDSGGVPTLIASADPQYDDPYAVLALKIHLTDFIGYQKSIASLPLSTRNDLLSKAFPQGQAPMSPLSAEFQPLLPFFLADLRDHPNPQQSWFSLNSLCYFTGPQVTAAADSLIESSASAKGAVAGNVWYRVKSCASAAVATAHEPARPSMGYRGGGGMNITAYAVQARFSNPNLEIESFNPPMVYWDGRHPVHFKDVTINDSGTAAGASVTRFYASSNLPVDPTRAQAIAERPVPLLPGAGTDTHEMDVMLPSTLPKGLYFIAPCANADRRLPQAFEEDRCRIPRREPPRPGS